MKVYSFLDKFIQSNNLTCDFLDPPSPRPVGEKINIIYGYARRLPSENGDYVQVLQFAEGHFTGVYRVWLPFESLNSHQDNCPYPSFLIFTPISGDFAINPGDHCGVIKWLNPGPYPQAVECGYVVLISVSPNSTCMQLLWLQVF